MLLSHKTSIKVSQDYANIIGHMCYAAYKLWNICNYERYHYKELGIENYPDWYYQKKVHKEDLWFKQLPSQSAQEVCKQLDKAWRSFFTLKRTGGIENPRPPRFKQEGISIVYMQNAVVHEKENGRVRLSLPKQLKIYMEERYGIHARFLYLENAIFRNMDHIKQIRIAPPQNGVCETIVVYEREDTELKPDNGHYLSIDLGLHNLMTWEMGHLLFLEENICPCAIIIIKRLRGYSPSGTASRPARGSAIRKHPDISAGFTERKDRQSKTISIRSPDTLWDIAGRKRSPV